MLENYQTFDPSPTLNRLAAIPSQVLQVSYKSKHLLITLDTGATVSYIRLDFVKHLCLEVQPNDQLALLADQKTRMASLGEVDFNVTLDNIQMRMRALVMRNLQAEAFGGTTFHADNNIQAMIKDGKINIHGKFTVLQFNPITSLPLFPPPSEEIVPSICSAMPTYLQQITSPESANKSTSRNDDENQLISRNDDNSQELKFNAVSLPTASVTYHSDYLPIPLPINMIRCNYVSITPSFPAAYDNKQWFPQVCEVMNGSAMFKNRSSLPLTVPKYSHFRPHLVSVCNLVDVVPDPPAHPPKPHIPITKLSAGKVCPELVPVKTADLISLISINKSIMSDDQFSRLENINRENHHVFDNDLSEGYNHQAGQFYADFTFSNKPPPTRVFVPQYNRKCSNLQQAQCDELQWESLSTPSSMVYLSCMYLRPGYSRRGELNTNNFQTVHLMS